MLVLFLAGLYLVFFVLLHLPVVKHQLGHLASDMLSRKLGTHVEVGSVDIGLFDRVTIEDVLVYDQNTRKMLAADRLSANVDMLELYQQKGRHISINSVQLFGIDANIYKETALSKPNFQFIIDSLSTKEQKEKTPLNLDISSIIIRDAKVRYDQLDAPETDGVFSPRHIELTELNSNIRLRKVTNDSLNVDITRLSAKEKSGLDVRSLTLGAVVSRSMARVSDLKLEMNSTALDTPLLEAKYEMEDGKLLKESIVYHAIINDTKITPCDIGIFLPKLKAINNSVNISGEVAGNPQEVMLSKVMVKHGDGLALDCDAYASFYAPRHWATDIRGLKTSSAYVTNILSALGMKDKLPAVVGRLGEVQLVARAEGDELTTVNLQGNIKTALGDADIKASRHEGKVSALVSTMGIKLGEIVENRHIGTFGNLTGTFDVTALLNGNRLQSVQAKADVSDFDFNSYRYKSIMVDGQYTADRNISGTLAVVSPSADVTAEGSFNIDGSHTELQAEIRNLQPSALNIPQLRIDGSFAGNINADLQGLNPKTMQGKVDMSNVKVHTKRINRTFDHIYAEKEQSGDYQKIKFASDFGYLDAEGSFDYATLVSSLTACLTKHLPSLPGLPEYKINDNNINLAAQITDPTLVQELLNIPLTLTKPVYVLADIDDSRHVFDVSVDAPAFSFKDNSFRNGYIHMKNVADSLKAYINVDIPSTEEVFTHCSLKTAAFDDQLKTRISFQNNGLRTVKGALNADAVFSLNEEGKPKVNVHVQPSAVTLADSIWNILSSDIAYSAGHLDIRNLSVASNSQYITVNGHVSDEGDDNLFVDLSNVDVATVLNLVRFRAVQFDGRASGLAKVSNLFGEPVLDADLRVDGFRFETGRLGDLTAKANWDIKNGDILIDAIAEDEGNRYTLIDGFISPKRKELDLGIKARGTRLEFVEKYTSSFLDNINVFGNGDVRLYGPLKAIELTGNAVIGGSVYLPPLNTSYTTRDARVVLTQGDIFFDTDTLRDRYNNIGIANGHLYHSHFKNMRYAFDIEAQNLLGFDTHSFGSDTFYGTAYATGNCIIRGKSGETIIDITCTPGPGTKFVYNVSSPDAISNADFVHWTDRNMHEHQDAKNEEKKRSVRSDLKLNFDINATPDLTLELLMDASNGDYISLNGRGNLTATYYNKGAFNLYGNYLVDRGNYRLTVQSIIKRMFDFQSGGSIGFNGDAYNAKLNLQAMYPVNGVSLADINIGKRFNNNNIRVNCLMNITGTPYAPKVDFGLDMPTVSPDIKSMVTSLINSEDEMNQQVLYLLAVGRFFNPSNNYAESAAVRQSQTSLAMQSILSGTLSQQLSNALGYVVDNNNWNIGANISTGDEGFNNAEYEGLISGRMLNSRLLFNGQFGYRDNPNATTSFIGDFDLRYLLVPNGNAALKVYNQTNDKYFTKNSLNTQGIGLILKKDFSNWKDFFKSRP